VGGRTARAYEESKPLSARTAGPGTLPDLPTRRMVREWPSEVAAGSFKLDLSHMVSKQGHGGQISSRAIENAESKAARTGNPAWQTPRESPGQPEIFKEQGAQDALQNALIQSAPQRISAPPQVKSPTREDPCLR